MWFDFNALQKYGVVKELKRGEFICLENEEGHTGFLLLEGEAQVILNSFGNNSTVVKTLKPGTLFGEMSLLEGKPRTASIIAGLDDTKVVEIKKDDFLNLIKSEPNIGCDLFKQLSENLSDTLNRIGNNRATVAIKKNNIFLQLQRLTNKQFMQIVEEDSNHCITILNFLSRSLAEADKLLNEKVEKKNPK